MRCKYLRFQDWSGTSGKLNRSARNSENKIMGALLQSFDGYCSKGGEWVDPNWTSKTARLTLVAMIAMSSVITIKIRTMLIDKWHSL